MDNNKKEDFLSLEEIRDSLRDKLGDAPAENASLEELSTPMSTPTPTPMSTPTPTAQSAASVSRKMLDEATEQLTGQLAFNPNDPKNLSEADKEQKQKEKLAEFLKGSTRNIYSDSSVKKAPEYLKDVTTTIHKKKITEQDAKRFQNMEFSEKELLEYQRFKQNRLQKAKDFVLSGFTSHDKPPLFDDEAQEKMGNENETPLVTESLEDLDSLERRSSADNAAVMDYLKKFKQNRKKMTIGIAIIGFFSFLFPLLYGIGFTMPLLLTPELPFVYLPLQLLFVVGVGFLAKDILYSGIAGLIHKKPNRDSMVTLALGGCAVQILLLLILGGTQLINDASVFLLAPIGIFATAAHSLSNMLLGNRALQNFDFVISDVPQCGASIISNEELANAFTKGTVNHKPFVAFNRKTNFISDFVYYTFLDDMTDRVGYFLAPAALLLALVLGVTTFFVSQSLSVAITAFSAALCICAPFGYLFSVNVPLSSSCNKMREGNATALGFGIAEEFGQLNAALTTAHELFPKGCVTLRGMRVFHHHPIDNSIMVASSILNATNSVLRDMFMDVMLGRKDILQPVDSILLEDGLGISGWVNDRHVIIGSREMAINHNIEVPSIAEEQRLCPEGCDMVYLSISGELATAFVFSLEADQTVLSSLIDLLNHEVYLVVQTVDPVITTEKLSNVFQIDAEEFKILPARFNPSYRKQTEPTEALSSSIVNDGSFSSYIRSIISAKRLSSCFLACMIAAIASIVIGLTGLFIFGALNMLSQFSWTTIFLYELIWLAIIAVIPILKRS